MFPDIHFPFRKINIWWNEMQNYFRKYKSWSPAVLPGVLIPTVVKVEGKKLFLYLEQKQAHSFTFNKYVEINML